MEYWKIIHLLGTTLNEMLRFIIKKWVEFYDQSGNANDEYKPNKPIRFKTSMLRSDLCDFSDAYIVVKGTITVTNPDNNVYDKKLAFKNNAPFVSCISKINNTFIDIYWFRCCYASVQFTWIQQKLFKNNRKFLELLQRWTKQWCK